MPDDVLWSDWLLEQSTPCRRVTVKSRTELEGVLRNTQALSSAKIHAISSGHSTSAVARPVPNKTAIWLDRQNWVADRQGADWLKTYAFADGTRPKWIPACTTVADANRLLDQKGLGLINLGSYDAQSVYGAIATGTHGSGMASGPLADFVLSIDLTTVVRRLGVPMVRSFRIEPTNGITRRDRFEDDVGDVELIQDDATFFASVVSLGSLGIVTGLILRVRPRFWLRETRVLEPWKQFRDEVKSGHRANPADLSYADLVLTAMPVKRPGIGVDHQVLLTTRSVIKAPPHRGPDRNDARTKSAKSKYHMHGDSKYEAARSIAKMGSNAPRFGNFCTFQRLEDDAKEPPFESDSFRVFRSSVGDWLAATSSEIGVPREQWIDATDSLIAELKAMDAAGYHPLSPIGIRFQQASPHLFTQQHLRATATFETPVPLGAFKKGQSEATSVADTTETLKRLEACLVTKHAGRPHFGQRSALTPAQLKAAYGPAAWDAFRANRQSFDPYRIFANELTDTLGL
jgi:FAD/FMN-containing dehydrogenase